MYPSPAYLDDDDEIFGNGIKFSHPTGTLLPVKKATVNCKVHNKLSSTHTLIGSLLWSHSITEQTHSKRESIFWINAIPYGHNQENSTNILWDYFVINNYYFLNLLPSKICSHNGTTYIHFDKKLKLSGVHLWSVSCFQADALTQQFGDLQGTHRELKLASAHIDDALKGR